jgi:hypothetical protein
MHCDSVGFGGDIREERVTHLLKRPAQQNLRGRLAMLFGKSDDRWVAESQAADQRRPRLTARVSNAKEIQSVRRYLQGDTVFVTVRHNILASHKRMQVKLPTSTPVQP